MSAVCSYINSVMNLDPWLMDLSPHYLLPADISGVLEAANRSTVFTSYLYEPKTEFATFVLQQQLMGLIETTMRKPESDALLRSKHCPGQRKRWMEFTDFLALQGKSFFTFHCQSGRDEFGERIFYYSSSLRAYCI